MDSPIQKWEKSEAFRSVQSSSVLKSSLLPLCQGQGNSLIQDCVCSLKVVLQSDILLASLVFTLGSCIFHRCLTLFIRYGFYLKLMSFLSLTATHINHRAQGPIFHFELFQFLEDQVGSVLTIQHLMLWVSYESHWRSLHVPKAISIIYLIYFWEKPLFSLDHGWGYFKIFRSLLYNWESLLGIT